MDANSIIKRCTFVNNEGRYFGGAVFFGQENVNNKTTPLLDSCILAGNKVDQGGGGVYAVHATPTIRNSIIVNNTADYAGAVFGSHAAITVERCIISGNSVGKSTVVLGCVDPESDKRARITVNHCTVADNISSMDTSLGLYSVALDKKCINDTIINSIFWNNRSRFITDSTDIKVSYSCIQHGYAGDTIITDNPKMNADYSLKAGSPCLNKASDGTDIGAVESGKYNQLLYHAELITSKKIRIHGKKRAQNFCSGQHLYPSFCR